MTTLFFLPESEIFFEELNDRFGITEVFFRDLINLVKSTLQGLLGKLASSLLILHDLVVEYGEIQGETKLDGVARGKVDLLSLSVSLEGLVLNLLKFVTLCGLGDVAVIITYHLDEESLGLVLAGL